MDASSILFQGITWESLSRPGGWDDFFNISVHELADSKITHVWLPLSSADERPLALRIRSFFNTIWRYLPGRASDVDAARHDNTEDELKTLIKKAFQSKGIQCVAGIIIDQDVERLGAPGGSAFDYTMQRILKAALEEGDLSKLRSSNGGPPGMMGSAPENAVTFIHNHYLASPAHEQQWSSQNILLGYAYILTHPGIPSIFYGHFFHLGLKRQISKLIEIRIRNGIKSSSRLTILESRRDLYVAVVDDEIIVKVGPRYHCGYLIPTTFTVATDGDNFAVFERKPPLISTGQ